MLRETLAFRKEKPFSRSKNFMIQTRFEPNTEYLIRFSPFPSSFVIISCPSCANASDKSTCILSLCPSICTVWTVVPSLWVWSWIEEKKKFNLSSLNLFKAQQTVATPWTCAVVPSGSVIIDGLFVKVLGSTWIRENVPSPFVCRTVWYWNCKFKKK